MTTLHIRKTNSPSSIPRVVDWIVTLDDTTKLCTNCVTIDGTRSNAFIGWSLSAIYQWVRIGWSDGTSYHEVIKEADK